MQHWQEEFRKKCITAQQAAGMIKDNDRIMTGNRDCRAILCELVKRYPNHAQLNQTKLNPNPTTSTTCPQS